MSHTPKICPNCLAPSNSKAVNKALLEALERLAAAVADDHGSWKAIAPVADEIMAAREQARDAIKATNEKAP